MVRVYVLTQGLLEIMVRRLGDEVMERPFCPVNGRRGRSMVVGLRSRLPGAEGRVDDGFLEAADGDLESVVGNVERFDHGL